MKSHWTDWVLLAAMAGAACVTVYAAMVRVMRQAVAEKQRETDRQLSAMSATVNALQARVAELGGLKAEKGETSAFSEKADAMASRKLESPAPETVAVLTAAAAAFLGKQARVRSAHMMPAEQSGAGTWAQQGRAFVQTSHNPRARG